MLVGLDVGGTYTDAVLIKDGHIFKKTKVRTNSQDLVATGLNILESLLKDQDLRQVKRIVISTTLSTNAIVEGKIPPVGIIVTSGPGVNPENYKIGDFFYTAKGIMDHRGREIVKIDQEEISNICSELKGKGINHLAVIGKFSPRNPEHEKKIQALAGSNFVCCSMGHKISGSLNFPRRITTAYLNAAVHDIHLNFVRSFRFTFNDDIVDIPLYILKADGGTMLIHNSINMPVQTVLSGPAAGIMGLMALCSVDKDAVGLDIGGTTTDISLFADGVPLMEPYGIKIGGHQTLVRALTIRSIGIGGDSLVKLTPENQLQIGPVRMGPAMAFGGEYPTPTDAAITLSMMEEGNKEKATRAMKSLGDPLGLSPEKVAEKIINQMAAIIYNEIDILIKEVNQRPVYTIHELLENRQIIPEKLIVIGGPAPFLGPFFANRWSMDYLIPPHADVANAIGAAVARTTSTLTSLADTEQGVVTVAEEGYREKIDKDYTIDDLIQLSLKLIRDKAIRMGSSEEDIELEIIEKQSFNMVRGFYTCGKNLRIMTQVKPGIIYPIKGAIA